MSHDTVLLTLLTLKFMPCGLQKYTNIWLKYIRDTENNTNHTIQRIFIKETQLGNHHNYQRTKLQISPPSLLPSSLPSRTNLYNDSYHHQYFVCFWTLHKYNYAVCTIFLLFCNCFFSQYYLQKSSMLL